MLRNGRREDVYQQRPDLIDAARPKRQSMTVTVGRVVTAGLVCALAVAAFAAPFASGLPDGLDSVAERFRIAASEQTVSGLFADYDAIPMAGWQGLSVSLAGIGGSLAVFAAAVLIGRALPAPRGLAVAEVSGE
mgnify:CR=1 FL=1